MKKTYAKPQLFAEAFQLTEHISLVCTKELFTPHHSTGWTCSIEWINGEGQKEIMFTDQNGACAGAVDAYIESLQDDDLMTSKYSESCYTTMSPGTMFSS